MERSSLIGGLIMLVLVMGVFSCTGAFAYWQENGTPVCTETHDDIYPDIAADGIGGAFIAWCDYRNGTDLDIYAQHVDARGRVSWIVDGVAICTGIDGQWYPEIISDGAGGAIITWRDDRNSTFDSDIYAQRVDASGAMLWSPDGAVICTLGSVNQYDPQITTDGAGGAIITWDDQRGTDIDIYAQRVDASGTVPWTAGGVAICTDTLAQRYPRVAPDGVGGAFITWQDYRKGVGDWDIYVQRVDSLGVVLFDEDGDSVCEAANDQQNPQIVSDGAGGVIITWRDYRGGADYDIYAQRVGTSGSVLWTPDGVAVCTAAGIQTEPRITSDGAGGAIIAWQDQRGTDIDIYAQRVDASGSTLWGANGVGICTAIYDQESPEIISDGAGGAIITWQQDPGISTNSDIYAQRVDTSGSALWQVGGVAGCTARREQNFPEIVTDGSGGGIIVWRDYRENNSDIYAQRIERNGYWGYPAPDIYAVCDVPGDQGGCANVAWDASRLDPWPEMLISNYTVWRAISAEAVAGIVEEGGHVLTSISDVLPEPEGSVLRVEEVENQTYYWKLMSTIDAYYLDAYSEVVATLFDSTSVCDEYHYFQVIAHTSTPSVFWVSEADSGYSVDNLSPDAPQGVAGDYSYPPSELLITWEPNAEADLSHYAVYKGDHEDFVPGEGNRLGTVQDTFFVDDTFDLNVDNYYKVSAWDVHENESRYSLLRAEEITGVSSPPAVPTVTMLEQNVPNPFNPVTVIRFSVAEPGWVTLVVFDVSGRPVRTLVQGVRAADRYEVVWDGRDGAGRAVASGVYLYQLEAPGYLESKKMVLLK